MFIKYELFGIISLLVILIFTYLMFYLESLRDSEKNTEYLDLRNKITKNDIYINKCWIELFVILLVCTIVGPKKTYLIMLIAIYFYLPKCFSLVTSLQRNNKLTIWL